MSIKDGGPAYPVPAINVERMEIDWNNWDRGMSLRDAFAMAALTGLAALSAHPRSPSIDGQAQMAYDLADAMIKARQPKEPI